jgi:hypothetical protein
MKRGQFIARRRRLFAVLSVVGVLAVGGSAWAYFTSLGSGAGQGSTGTMSTVTLVSATAVPTTPLLPGGTGDVQIRIHNPNASSVSLVAISRIGTVTFDSGHSGCTTTDSNPVVTLSVPAADLPQSIGGGATNSFDLVNAVTMDSAATSNCQGASISIPVTITVEQR